MTIAIKIPSPAMDAALCRVLIARGFLHHGDSSDIEQILRRTRSDGQDRYYHTLVFVLGAGIYYRDGQPYKWSHSCASLRAHQPHGQCFDLTQEPDTLAEVIELLSSL